MKQIITSQIKQHNVISLGSGGGEGRMLVEAVGVEVRAVGELAGVGGVPGIAAHPRHAAHVLRRHPSVVPPTDTQHEFPVTTPGEKEDTL